MNSFKAVTLSKKLSPALRPALRASYIPRRFAGSKDLADPSSAQNQDARLARQEEATGAMAEHSLDYDAHVDHGTSYADRFAHDTPKLISTATSRSSRSE